MHNFIFAQDIAKNFGRAEVLRGVDLEINKGEVFGLVGMNGAGKTTLMRILLGLARASRGRILFNGKDLADRDVQECFGFLPENFLPPQNLTGREFLNILSYSVGKTEKNTDYLLDLTGLSAHKNKYLRHFSRGMIQKFGLCCALVKDPKVVVLDEPTLGLDPPAQKNFMDILGDLRAGGKTIFFSSHILAHIERVCDRIGILNAGRVVFTGACRDLKNKHGVSDLEEAFLREINSGKQAA
jgi:ABC-type multidrug transport system ATPase subunit